MKTRSDMMSPTNSKSVYAIIDTCPHPHAQTDTNKHKETDIERQIQTDIHAQKL